jgi:hypothetical protein
MPAIGWSLLHFVWQGLLIGWAASLALQLLRNARPQARYAVACGALLLCAALPLAGIVWRVLDAANAAPAADPAVLLMAGSGALGTPAMAMPALDGDRLISWQYMLQRQLPWLVLLWASGAAFMTLRLSLGLLWVRERTWRRSKYRTPIGSGAWTAWRCASGWTARCGWPWPSIWIRP